MPSKNADKKKILFVIFDEIPSLSDLSCWMSEEIRSLSSRYDVDVLSLKSEDLSHIERFHGARLLRVPVGSGPFLSQIKTFQRALSRQLGSEDYRLCHFTSVWEGMVLASGKQDGGYKLVYEVHSLPSVDFKILHPDEAPEVEQSYPLKQQEERCLAQADQILVGSELLKDHISSRGLPEERISLVRPAIDLLHFDNVDNVPRLPGTVLYLGNLAPWEGVPSLLMAVSELPHGLPVKLHLICPKNDPFRKEVLGKIQMLGLARKVELIDPVPFEELPSIVARADVCVAPMTIHEHNRLAATTPQKMLIYMACRRPMVTSRQPIASEIMEDGVHGLMYTPGDSRGLAEALKKLLLDRELAMRLGNQARLHLEESAFLEESTRKLRSIYRKLIGRHQKTTEGKHLDSDTLPGIPEHSAKNGSGVEPDTSPRVMSSEDEGNERTEDTTPGTTRIEDPPTAPRAAVPGAPANPPEPPLDKEAEAARPESMDDIVFHSVEDEDTAPRRSPDRWQVMDVSLVMFPPEEEEIPEEAGSDENGRWLLGGPPFPVRSDDPSESDDAVHKAPTKRVPETSPSGLTFVPDAEVELIDGDTDKGQAHHDPPTDPEMKAK